MKKIFYFFLVLLYSTGCIQKFQPALSSPLTGYLVVEGIINANGPANFMLSRTTSLNDSSIVYETGAAAQVEGNDNSIYTFTEQGNGTYGINLLNLNVAQQYRLRIKTKAGKEYLSDYSQVKTTPAIDSINWQLATGGVQIYVNTHDVQNNTLYYKWDYEETWEFHSPFIKTLQYDTVFDYLGKPELSVKLLDNGQDFSIFTCWQADLSNQILVASSNSLSSDVISNFPIVLIPQTSVKLNVDYSILVKQYALPVSAYNFLQIMKTNTEQTGSIFDGQPSALQANIHSLSNPSETIVGYVSFCTTQSKRIFINTSQLPAFWSQYNSGCVQDSILTQVPGLGDPYREIKTVFANGFVPTVVGNLSGGSINIFLTAPPACVDCTLTGTNQKPSFWQ